MMFLVIKCLIFNIFFEKRITLRYFYDNLEHICLSIFIHH